MKIDSFTGRHRYLSNFAPAPVIFEGVVYLTVENAYQAAKTLNPEERKQFEHCTPGRARMLGKKLTLRPDWENVKLEIMEDLLRKKFFSGSMPLMMLMNTQGAYLEEGNTWGDTYWGVCKGVGENRLGKLLMKVRSEKMREVKGFV
jgi:ribA/ribD-fused uncharacterized protein